MTQAETIVAEARALIGVPYQHRQFGELMTDCFGVLRTIGGKISFPIPPIPEYGKSPSARLMRRMLDENLIRIKVSAIVPGDVLHMAWAQQPQHLAVVVCADPLRIVHASSECGKVVEVGVGKLDGFKIRAAYRVPVI